MDGDLILKENDADKVVVVTIRHYDGTEKKLTILFNSFDDWRYETGQVDKLLQLNFFAAAIFRAIYDDRNIHLFLIQRFNIVTSTEHGLKEILKPDLFVREGEQFRYASINKDGDIIYLTDTFL